jgi:hypothetical protein
MIESLKARPQLYKKIKKYLLLMRRCKNSPKDIVFSNKNTNKFLKDKFPFVNRCNVAKRLYKN